MPSSFCDCEGNYHNQETHSDQHDISCKENYQMQNSKSVPNSKIPLQTTKSYNKYHQYQYPCKKLDGPCPTIWILSKLDRIFQNESQDKRIVFTDFPWTQYSLVSGDSSQVSLSLCWPPSKPRLRRRLLKNSLCCLSMSHHVKRYVPALIILGYVAFPCHLPHTSQSSEDTQVGYT